MHTDFKDHEQYRALAQKNGELIKCLVPIFHQMDFDFLRKAAKDTLAQSTRQESLSVLNPSYPQSANDLLRLKGKAINQLCDYVDTLKQIDFLTEKVSQDKNNNQKINELFV